MRRKPIPDSIRMREITDVTRSILEYDPAKQFILSQLATIVVKKATHPVTAMDIRKAVWRLLDSGEAKMISGQVQADINNIQKLRQLREEK